MMKSLFLASLLTIATTFGEEFAQAAYLETPLPEKRVDSFLNGRALAIKSEYILKECVKSLDLPKRWNVSEAEAIKSLSKKISASREPGTDLLRIEVTGSSEKEAEDLLNKIIQANISRFSRVESDQKNEYLHALNQELMDQGALVQDYRKALTVLIQQYGVPYFDQKGTTIGETEMALYRKSQEELAKLERQRNVAQIQVRQLLDTPNDDLIRLSEGMDLPKNRISKYYQSYLSLAGKVDALKTSGLASGHPEVATLKQQMELALSNAGREVVGVKEIQETKLNLLDKEVEKMKKEVRERNDGCVALSMQQHQYHVAAKEYEAATALYYKMSRQQQELRIEAKMPATSYLIHKIP